MNDPTPADPTSPASNAPTALGGSAVAMPATPSSAVQVAELLAAGKIDTTQAAKLAKAGGFSALQVAQSMHIMRGASESQPDLRSDEEKQLDAAFPQAQASAYTIRYYPPGQEPREMPKEVKAFDSNARGWMASAGMPKEIGDSLARAIGRTVDATQGMSPKQLEWYGQQEFEKLQQAHGERLEERLHLAAEMIHELDVKTPGLKQLLKSKGIGDSALVVNLLLGHAQIFHARKQAQGR